MINVSLMQIRLYKTRKICYIAKVEVKISSFVCGNIMSFSSLARTLTNTRSDGGSALLVSLGASIAGQPSHSSLTDTLT